MKVPYHGTILEGPVLEEQIEKWVQKGVIDVGTGQSMINVVKNDSWCDLSDQTVVLCGAGSAMGPFYVLMAMGANVVALDLKRKGIWDRLIKVAKESPGTLTFPLAEATTDESKMSDLAGCDLLAQTPEVRNWLLTVRKGERLIVGAYAYLDGPLFLRVSMAMDAVIESLIVERTPKIGVAYLCTPTDAHVMTPGANKQAITEYGKSPMWQHLYALVMVLQTKILD